MKENGKIIEQQNYSQKRLYERDSKIYGKGVLRASDTIIIKETEPGYYSAIAKIDPFVVDKNIEKFTTKLNHSAYINNLYKNQISKIEVHGVAEKEELETYLETLQLTQSGLKFKNELSSDTDIIDYLRERAIISKNGNEISIAFDFSDNPIISESFNIGFSVDATLKYEDYYEATDPSYRAITYAYVGDGIVAPQTVETHNEKVMAKSSDSESIVVALASHQQLIKMVKTEYTEDFVEEHAVTPMNSEYTYRLNLRNGYNTLINTEIIDILEHSELTVIDGENPYPVSEWYGTFKSLNVTQIEEKGLGTKVYYANTLTPDENSWILMESYENGIWTTANEVKAVKVKIEGEIVENSIIYVDVNMLAPNDANLEDKKAYNSYFINSDAIDLYTGMQSSYLEKMPSNNVDIKLTQKEYNIEITKTDSANGNKLSGVVFGIYDTEGNKLMSNLTGMLGIAELKGLKEGTYIIKEELALPGYEKAFDELILTIQDGEYTLLEKYTEIENQHLDITFTSSGNYAWTQNEDGAWQSNNYKVNSSSSIMTTNEFTIVKEGTLTFDWAISSESMNTDYVCYTIKNAVTNATVYESGYPTRIGGNSTVTEYDSLTFKSVKQYLDPGTYKIEFKYVKDSSNSSGLDRAYVKNVDVVSKIEVKKDGETVSGDSIIKGKIPTIELNVENSRANGSITVYKKDEYLNSNKKEIPLSGVTFELLDSEGNFIEEGKTDSKGKIIFKELDWGKTYFIKEKIGRTGYEFIDTNITTYLSRLNKDKVVTVDNKRKTGTAILTKQDEITKTKLSGAVYGLYANDYIYNKEGNVEYEPNELIEEQTTNEDGQVIFENLIWGKYYIKEISTVYGYELSEIKYEFTISEAYVENIIEKTEDEERRLANLQLIKIDENGNFLPGAEFAIYTEDGRELTIQKYKEVEFSFNETEDSWTQNEDGVWQSSNYNKANTTSTLESNEFIMPEKGRISFDWAVSSQGAAYDYAYYTITNTETGDVIGGTSTKIGGITDGKEYDLLNYNFKSENLEPGTYKIQFAYTKNASSNSGLDRAFIKNVKAEYMIPNMSEEDGQLNIYGIAWGNYYLKEVKAPDGYELDDTKYFFTVDRETFRIGNDTITIVRNEKTGEEGSIIRNNRKRGKVSLTKYACDTEGNETTTVLEGAVYELYSSDGTLVGEYTTNAEGKIIVDNLDWDSYYFLEKQAPTGFSLSDKKIAFVINSKNAHYEQALTAYDKQESGEIKINKTIQSDSLYGAHGNSTFIFKIVGKDENGDEKVTLYRTITFTEQDKNSKDENGDITKTITISDVQKYNYEITEEENYRYELSSIIPVTNAGVNGETGIINFLETTENKGEISFVNEKTNNSLLTDNGLITNTAQNKYYLLGIGAEVKGGPFEISTQLTANDFTYTLYYSGGQEQIVEADSFESVTINGGEIYTEDLVGNHIANIQAVYNGRTYEAQVPIKWVMPSDYFNYTVKDQKLKTIIITGINSKYTSPEVLYIPREYNGYKVADVAANKYNTSNRLSNITNVKTVEIEEGIETIGQYAFYRTNLEKIKLPSTITEIRQGVFSYSNNLESIDLSNTQITNIKYETFEKDIGLKTVKLPKSLTTIDSDAFSMCTNLTNVDFSNTQLETIDEMAFYECNNLTSIGDFPETITTIGERAFYNCKKLTDVDFSDTNITTIGKEAFSKCTSLTALDFSNTQLTSIGQLAFDGCTGITTVGVFPETLKTIEANAFGNCNKITSMDFSKTQVVDFTYTALPSSLEYLKLPATFESIDNKFSGYYFKNLVAIEVEEDNEHNCSVDGVLYSKDMTQLIRYPANKTDLTSYVVPDTVTSIGNGLAYSKLVSIDLSNTKITSLDTSAFQACKNLTELILPNTITSIGKQAFNDCTKIKSLDLSDMQITSIGESAFRGCSSLQSIELPQTVTSIGSSAFDYCKNLKSINLGETKITSISNRAFGDCLNLTSIEIPDTVTSIGNLAFYNCKKLTTIDIPKNVTSIGDNITSGCSQLTAINVDEENEYYSSADGVLFNKDKTTLIVYPQNKADVQEYIVPESVTIIEKNAFKECINLISVDLSNTKETELRENVFRGCDNLTNIKLPSTITTIGVYSFEDCDLLESIDFSNTQLTTINARAFNSCSKLTSISLPSTVTNIGGYAFSGCSSLTTVNYYGTEEQFAAITVGSGNTLFTDATVNYITQ